MPYAEDLMKVTVHFTLGIPIEEESQFGYYLKLDKDPAFSFQWDDDIQGISDVVRDKTDTWWNLFKSHCHSTVQLSHVKCTHIDTSGHALDIATSATSLDDADRRGTSGGNPLPYEVSRCVTMYGYDPGVFVADKRRRRGRCYLPPETVSMMGLGGRFSASSSDTALSNWDAYMEDVQGMETPRTGDATTHFDVVIASRYGLASQVQAYSIGDVPDAQRRRRRSQDEVRVQAVLSNH